VALPESLPRFVRAILTKVSYFDCANCPNEADHACTSSHAGCLNAGGSISSELRCFTRESEHEQERAPNDSLFHHSEFTFLPEGHLRTLAHLFNKMVSLLRLGPD
jgi:hypothetical protein